LPRAQFTIHHPSAKVAAPKRDKLVIYLAIIATLLKKIEIDKVQKRLTDKGR
jgi:hypothetical protein